jgi:hypothetical protein
MAARKQKRPTSDYVAAIKDHTKALRSHIKAINTLTKAIAASPLPSNDALKNHADALSAFVESSKVLALGKTISRSSILSRLAQKWGKLAATIKLTDPISKYVIGGPGVMAAYADELNNSPEFSPDGLNLETNDTSFVTTVGGLVTAIAGWYTRNHWIVTG